MLKSLKFFFIVVVLFSCSEADPDSQSRLVLKLIDSAGDYEQVNIHVVGAEINVDGEWVELDVNEEVYDLCELVNGTSEVIANEDIPAGEIGQLRLLLGEQNTLKLRGEDDLVPLSTPSGQTSGYKIKIQDNLTAGITYNLVIDFDASRSVVKAGNSGKYNLKPVVRAFPEALDGAISGSITPIESSPTIYAILGSDTITSTLPDENGFFLLRGLSEADFTVGIQPIEGYSDVVLEEIEIITGQITELGTIQIPTE